MFWSGMKDSLGMNMAQEYCNRAERPYTLEGTLAGFILDKLQWCGTKDGKGFNYTTCPGWTECANGSALRLFWERASIKVSLFESQEYVVQ